MAVRGGICICVRAIACMLYTYDAHIDVSACLWFCIFVLCVLSRGDFL